MKKLLLIALILFTTLAYSQKPKVSAVRYTEVTTTERDNYSVPAGEFWRIYNTTTTQNEYWDGDSWEALSISEATFNLNSKNYSWGESYINNWRDLVLDDGATYFPNNGGYEIGRLHQAETNPSLHFIPAAVGEGVIYAIGKNRVNDLTVDRNSIATYIDEDRILRTAAFDFARIDYTDGDGAILAEDEGTNLIERSESFGHSYWTKSGVAIEGDASTAGSEMVINGDMETGGTVDVSLPTGWSLVSSPTAYKANTASNGGTGKVHSGTYSTYINGINNNGINQPSSFFVIGKTYRVSSWVWVVTGQVRFNGTNVNFIEQTSTTTGEWEELTTTFTYSTGTDVHTRFRCIGASEFYVDDVSIKEVQGFSAPDGSTNAYKLIANANNGFIQLASSETISNATSYTNSIFIKRAIGTGNILIKDINNAETNVSTLTGVELADNWTRYDITDTSSSTSGQIGVKLATSGDEVYIFGADLKEDLGSSYIKSDSGSSTTRLKDVITGAGDSNTFNSVSGSFKVNIRALSNDLTVRTISTNDSTASNAITIGYSTASNTILAEYIISGSPVASLTYQVSDITEYHDVEFQYALNDFKLLIDDVERDTDVSGAVLSAGTLNSLDYHNGGGSNSFFGKQKQLIIQK